MKRILAIILAAVMMTAVLCACGAKEVDLNDVMTSVNAQLSADGLKTIEDTDGLNRYYMIGADDVKQFAAELSTTAKQYTEVILIEAKDANAASNIMTQLNAHLSTQLNTAKSYDADQVAMIESCSVKQNGNYVYLVVSDKAAEINGVIEAALK